MSTNKVVSYEEMKNFANSDSILLIDVRKEEEVNSTGKIGQSINIPIDELENVLKNLDQGLFEEKYARSKPGKDFPIVFYCLMGGRAARAADIAENVGYKNSRFYKGSWQEWQAKSN